MKIKLLNYSIFITESELSRISYEDFEIVKQTVKTKRKNDINRDMDSAQSNRTYIKKYGRGITNQSYINKENSAHDICIYFCKDMNVEDKQLYSTLISSEMGIQNTDMFIDVLSKVLKKASIKSIVYVINQVEKIKNKIINNEQLNDSDIEFNKSLANLINAIINRYYQDVNPEVIVTKLTTTYLYEKQLLVKKLK